jgi:HEAT repeat protein
MLCVNCTGEMIVPSGSEIAPPEVAPPIALPNPIPVAAPLAGPPSWRPRLKRLPTARIAVAFAAFIFFLCLAVGLTSKAWSKWIRTKPTDAIALSEQPNNPDTDDPAAADAGPIQLSPEERAANAIDEPERKEMLVALAKLSSVMVEEDEIARETIKAAPADVKILREKNSSRLSGSATIVVKHRKKLDEDDLRRQLLWAPEVGLHDDDVPPLLQSYLANLHESATGTTDLNQEPSFLLAQRPDLKALPIRRGRASRLDAKAAMELQRLSSELHALLDRLAPKDDDGNHAKPVLLGELMKLETVRNTPVWLRPEAIPTLMQILMFEDEPVRLLLVQMLSAIEGREASAALAKRAVFDLSDDVRAAALKSLNDRPHAEYRQVFLDALRYPWAPAADHAAEALVALEDRDAAPMLAGLLKEPDPSAPVMSHDRFWKREVVRIMHVQNCLTCHPPAISGFDPVQGAVPGVNQIHVSISRELAGSSGSPTPSSGGGGSNGGGGGGGGSSGGGGGGAYGGSGSGSSSAFSGGGGSGTSLVRVSVPGKPGQTRAMLVGQPSFKTVVNKKEVPVMVRADITYLRQDFSVLQPVRQPGGVLPLDRRFDYVVRFRPLNEKQQTEWKARPDKLPDTYDQREAVLFALRDLTGQDAGNSTADWEKLFPSSNLDKQASELTAELVNAPDHRKAAVLKKLKETKGAAYSQALAAAIPQLFGKQQEKARVALAERMARMTPATLRNKLGDDDREIRYAAAVACSWKEDKTLIPDLRSLLDDSEPTVAEAAHASIKSLGGAE